MAVEKYTNDQILKMMSLSEEINQINLKVRQLVEDLHGAEGVIGTIKELSQTLQEKVKEFGGGVSSFTPSKVPHYENSAKPSYIEENVERERVVPTPATMKDYAPTTRYNTGNAPTIQTNAPIEKPASVPIEKPVKEKKVVRTKKASKKRVKSNKVKPPTIRRGASKVSKPKRKNPRGKNKPFGGGTMNIDKFAGGKNE